MYASRHFRTVRLKGNLSCSRNGKTTCNIPYLKAACQGILYYPPEQLSAAPFIFPQPDKPPMSQVTIRHPFGDLGLRYGRRTTGALDLIDGEFSSFRCLLES
jgi:hypothetical protein